MYVCAMLIPRVIPCLLLRGKGLVKGTHFKDHRYIGDPINAVQIYNTMGADELLFLDISATAENRIPDLQLIQKISDQCLMPFGVGGGIKSVEDARAILKAGAEKVCINTAAFERPELVSEIANTFGNQSVVVSLDVKKNWLGKYEAYVRCGSHKVGGDIFELAAEMERRGAGEILVNSIDKDGTMSGFDIEITRKIAGLCNLPVIVCGGAGSVHDLKTAITEGKADAVAAGSLFVFHGPRKAVLINYPNEKELKEIHDV